VKTLESRVQWLVDRAEIHDLILGYARCVDTKDWDGFADLFADDGCILLPFGKLEKKDLARATAAVLSPFEGTQHLFANVGIHIKGDLATSNHYLQAVHVPASTAQGTHADIAAGTTTPTGAPTKAGGSSPSTSPLCGAAGSHSSRGTRTRDSEWTPVPVRAGVQSRPTVLTHSPEGGLP